MTEIRNYDTTQDVAKAAAENAVEILNLAISERGSATWVLAGGSSPVAAYKELIASFAGAVDWSKVTVLMGDERYAALDQPDSNWGTIVALFDAHPAFDAMHRLGPTILESVERTAEAYNAKVMSLGVERFDLVWLGVGEDGHTLSLFPDNPGLTEPTTQWVIPVYDSPKPPAQRISLSLKALEHIDELVIFATGASKHDALKTARLQGTVPIAIAAQVAEANGAEVRWLYDAQAWGS
jgi:6-phosphogluconolactonase